MNLQQSKLLHEELVKTCTIQTCLNCENYLEKAERCTLAPAYSLPAQVIVFGCPKWIPMIPF